MPDESCVVAAEYAMQTEHTGQHSNHDALNNTFKEIEKR